MVSGEKTCARQGWVGERVRARRQRTQLHGQRTAAPRSNHPSIHAWQTREQQRAPHLVKVVGARRLLLAARPALRERDRAHRLVALHHLRRPRRQLLLAGGPAWARARASTGREARRASQRQLLCRHRRALPGRTCTAAPPARSPPPALPCPQLPPSRWRCARAAWPPSPQASVWGAGWVRRSPLLLQAALGVVQVARGSVPAQTRPSTRARGSCVQTPQHSSQLRQSRRPPPPQPLPSSLHALLGPAIEGAARALERRAVNS